MHNLPLCVQIEIRTLLWKIRIFVFACIIMFDTILGTPCLSKLTNNLVIRISVFLVQGNTSEYLSKVHAQLFTRIIY